jgi:hypothetical protein
MKSNRNSEIPEAPYVLNIPQTLHNITACNELLMVGKLWRESLNKRYGL